MAEISKRRLLLGAILLTAFVILVFSYGLTVPVPLIGGWIAR